MPVERSRRPYQATYAVLALAVGGYPLLQSLVIPVLPRSKLDCTPRKNSVTWVPHRLPIVGGHLHSHHGADSATCTVRKRLLVVTLVALTLGSLLAAVASSITLMIVARVIQGSVVGSFPLSFGLIRDEFPEGKGDGRDRPSSRR